MFLLFFLNADLPSPQKQTRARHPASIASLALAQAFTSSFDVERASRAARHLSAALESKKDESDEENKDDAETPPLNNADAADPSAEALKIATATGAVGSISKALTLFEKGSDLLKGNKEDLEALLSCMTRLCSSSCDAGRDAAGAAGVPAKLCDLLGAVNGEEEEEEEEEGPGSNNEPDLVAALASAAAAAATAHEGNKCALVDCGFGAAAAAALLRGGNRSSSSSSSATKSAISPVAIRSLSSALCSLATADDPRPAASRAFQNGRTLGSEGVPSACLSAFRRAVAEARKKNCSSSSSSAAAALTSAESWLDTAASAAMAARRAVVNDELCREFAAAGGATAVLRAMLPAEEESISYSSAAFPASSSSCSTPLHHVKLARSCCSLLRQLAGSDALKELIVEEGGFKLVTLAVTAHPGKHSVAEQALGLLVSLTLRNPDACPAAVEAGCARAAADVLRSEFSSGPSSSKKQDGDDENAAPCSSSSKSSSSNGKGNFSSSSAPSTTAFSRNPHQWAQRQACAAIRNLVSRNPELRPVLLSWSSGEQGDNGDKIEPLLREARDRYPDACGDVGAAALRDLGCDDYDGKKKKKNAASMNSTGAYVDAAKAARAEADGRFGVAI